MMSTRACIMLIHSLSLLFLCSYHCFQSSFVPSSISDLPSVACTALLYVLLSYLLHHFQVVIVCVYRCQLLIHLPVCLSLWLYTLRNCFCTVVSFPGWPSPKIARLHKSHGKGNENVDLMMLRRYVVRMLKGKSLVQITKGSLTVQRQGVVLPF